MHRRRSISLFFFLLLAIAAVAGWYWRNPADRVVTHPLTAPQIASFSGFLNIDLQELVNSPPDIGVRKELDNLHIETDGIFCPSQSNPREFNLVTRCTDGWPWPVRFPLKALVPATMAIPQKQEWIHIRGILHVRATSYWLEIEQIQSGSSVA